MAKWLIMIKLDWNLMAIQLILLSTIICKNVEHMECKTD